MYNFYPKKLVQPPGCAPQILLIMKLTMLILITAILHVSAKTFAQKITLSEKNALLNKIFEKISNQTGYDFLVSTADLKQAKPVTVDVQYTPGISTDGMNGKVSRYKNISQVLKALEATKTVHFKVEGRRVTVLK